MDVFDTHVRRTCGSLLDWPPALSVCQLSRARGKSSLGRHHDPPFFDLVASLTLIGSGTVWLEHLSGSPGAPEARVVQKPGDWFARFGPGLSSGPVGVNLKIGKHGHNHNHDTI